MNAKDVPKRTFVIIWILLLGFLLLNWGLAQFNLGSFNLVAAIAIATTQMLLSISFLMHAKWSPRLTLIFIAAGFIWLMVMLDLTLSDYLTRHMLPDRYSQTWRRTETPPQKLEKQK